MDILDEEDFYEAMQLYRHSPITDPSGTVLAFEAVKKFIRENMESIEEGK
jgi:hypothetical protein